MDKRKVSECERGVMISFSEVDGVSLGSPAKAAKLSPKSRGQQTPASPDDARRSRREPHSQKDHGTQEGHPDEERSPDDEDGSSDGISAETYLPNTKIPTAGWFQPCRSCRKWTAATLTINDADVSICKQCQLDFVRQHYLAKQHSQDAPRAANNSSIKLEHAAIETASLEVGVDAGRCTTSSVESSPGQYMPPRL